MLIFPTRLSLQISINFCLTRLSVGWSRNTSTTNKRTIFCSQPVPSGQLNDTFGKRHSHQQKKVSAKRFSIGTSNTLQANDLLKRVAVNASRVVHSIVVLVKLAIVWGWAFFSMALAAATAHICLCSRHCSLARMMKISTGLFNIVWQCSCSTANRKMLWRVSLYSKRAIHLTLGLSQRPRTTLSGD